MCSVLQVQVWSDYWRFPINMVFAAYLLENAILVLSRVGQLHPTLNPTVGFLYEHPPHHGAFAAFPKQNDQCLGWGWGRGMGTIGID